MRWIEIIEFGTQNLRRRKGRTFLTVLAVSIGVASIIVMMSLGIGMNESFLKQVEQSSTLTLIRVSSYENELSQSKGDSSAIINNDTVELFKQIEHVAVASPVYNFEIFAQYGKYEGTLYVTAVTNEMLHSLNLPILYGALPLEETSFSLIAGRYVGYNFSEVKEHGGDSKRVITENDFQNNPPNVDILNSTFWATYDIAGYRAFIDGDRAETPQKYKLNTVAMLGKDTVGEQGYTPFDYSVYADIAAVNTLFAKVFKKSPWPNQSTDASGRPIRPMSYTEAYIIVETIDDVETVQKRLTEMGYASSSDMDYLKTMQVQSQTIQLVFGGIGSVSLFVAAIGIMNTMMMNVMERTREIGILKVLGCSLVAIRRIFLAESGILGIMGGFSGTILSFLLSSAINFFLGDISSITVPLVLVGFGFAFCVGVVSGISPAAKAARLSPLEALRVV